VPHYTKSRFTGEKLLGTPLKLIGGKTKSRDFFYQYWPEDYDVYFEPFLGSGACYMGRQPVFHEVVCDINPHVIKFFNVLKEDPYGFWYEFQKLYRSFSKEQFEVCKVKILDENPVVSAAAFYLVSKHALNGIVRFNKKAGACNSSWCKTTQGRGILTFEWYEEVLKRIKDTEFHCMDYRDTIRRSNHYSSDRTFLFLDSPYSRVKTTYAGEYWHDSHFMDYVEAVKSIKGRFMITINDIDYTRELFKDFYIYPHTLFYSASNTAAGRGMKEELIITNYPIKERYEALCLSSK
jgi:DNA adenine methylase